MSVRHYPGRRSARVTRGFSVLTPALVCATLLMFAGPGAAFPLLGQGALLLTVVWLLFLGFDTLFPGVAFRRPRAVNVGADGLQTEHEFVPWSEVKRVTREMEALTPEQMDMQRVRPTTVPKRTHYVRVRTKDGASRCLFPAQDRRLHKELQRRLEEYQGQNGVPTELSDYRTPSEPEEPKRVVLDSRESREVRVAAFAELTTEEQEALVESMADEDMRRELAAS